MKTSRVTERFVNRVINGILGSVVIFFLIVFIYAIILIIYTDSNSKSNIYYAIISVIGIGLFSLAFKLRGDYKINLVLMALSLCVGVYLIEFLLLLVVGDRIEESVEETRVRLAHENDIPYDTRTPLQVVAGLVEQGVDAYPIIAPHTFIHSNGLKSDSLDLFPLGGMSQKATVFCNENGEYAIYESDEHGFNNPYGVFTQSDIDIILVGDSFTHGACVKPDEDIGGQLRKTGKRVINLGMMGSAPLLELAILKEYAEIMRPTVVLWMYYEGNDLRDLVKDFEGEITSPFLLHYLDGNFSQKLIDRQSEIDRSLKDYFERKKKQILEELKEDKNLRQRILSNPFIKLARLWHLRRKLGLERPPSQAVPPHPVFTQILEKARDMTSSWGGTLYFVYLPLRERYAKNVNYKSFMYRDQVMSIVQSLDIPIIDIHEVLMNHDDPLSLIPFRGYGHYTKEGYSLIAQKIAAYLESKHHK